jgi:hypothetical protein
MADENFTLSRHEFFCCTSYDNPNLSFIIMTTVRLFVQYIWDSKLRKQIPDIARCKNFIFSEVDLMKKINLRFRMSLNNSGVNFNTRRQY